MAPCLHDRHRCQPLQRRLGDWPATVHQTCSLCVWPCLPSNPAVLSDAPAGKGRRTTLPHLPPLWRPSVPAAVAITTAAGTQETPSTHAWLLAVWLQLPFTKRAVLCVTLPSVNSCGIVRRPGREGTSDHPSLSSSSLAALSASCSSDSHRRPAPRARRRHMHGCLLFGPRYRSPNVLSCVAPGLLSRPTLRDVWPASVETVFLLSGGPRRQLWQR